MVTSENNFDGDENSKYFHNSLKRKYNKNNIRGINVNGSWCENPNTIKEVAFNHFKSIFEVHNSDGPSLEGLFSESISSADNELLEAHFTEEEIWESVKCCGSSKAPGPDGFNFGFFKKFWSIIKDDLIGAINWFWVFGEFSKGCNASFVSLIPKKSDPLSFSDYRPISLICSYYKIIAKMLSLRIRKVVPRLIGKEQSAFLGGRYILDGALVANEVVEDLKRNKKHGLIFKVDFEKAFDSLNWDYLLEVMKCMGFGTKWCKWISSCLKSATISILINESPTSEFNLKRGVRQGDPLSPFLFIIAAEGLNILTKVAVERGMYKGVEVGISNDNVEALASWCSCLGGRLPFMYLGIPVGNRMKKLNDWSPVIEKFNKSIYGSNGGLVLGNGLARNPNASLWNSICDAGKHVDGLGISFSNSFIRSIGDGKSTSFWDDIWVGNASFKDRFKRLHRLEIDKDIKISSKIEEFKGDGLGNWAYPPMGRTNSELNELRDTVRNLQVTEGKKDCWSWNLNSKGIYTVKECSVIVDKIILPRAVNSIESLRNGLVPKKVEVFIWRARLGRIPVRFELDKRGIDLNSVRCPICDGDIETVEHILFSCQVAKDIWAKVLKWWGYNSAIFGFEDIFNGTFGCVAQDHKKNQWQAVCWVVCYILWKNRNAKVFKNKLETVPSLFSEVQVLSYDWISRRCKGHIMDWLQWFSHP
ncbi:uncharacterized protein [Rutidosis leptorrhynchoides]|uniref:uncharacterized protein n=1 Tax=Rutidosis leptorrhynchoides TaxID=125765 RepID=UPI003A99D823